MSPSRAEGVFLRIGMQVARLGALLFWVLTMAGGAASAQTVIYEQTISRDAVVRPTLRDTATPLYRTLAVLSRHTGKNYQKEGLRYSWQQTVRITENAPGRYRFQLYLENLQCRNAAAFKSVPIWRYLTLNRLDLHSTVVFVKKVLDVREDNYDLGPILAGTPYERDFADSTAPKKPWPRVTVAYSDLAFAEGADRHLDSILSQIDGFFTSKEELSYIISQSNPAADYQDADSVLAQALRLQSFENRFQQIRRQTIDKDFVGPTEFADYDRLLIETDSALVTGARASVARQQGLDELLYKKAFQFYRFGKRAEARQYLAFALSFNPNHEASLTRLVTIHLEQQQFDSAARILVRHSATFQGLTSQRLVERAAKGLEKRSLSLARDGDPGSVRPVVGLLDSLCKSFPGYRCPDLSASAASGVVRADFQKLLNGARGQASQNHYDDAEALAEQALAFSKSNALPSANEEAARYLLDQVRARNVQTLTYQARDAFRRGKDSLGLALAQKAYQATNKIGSRPELLAGVINSGVKDVITNQVNESIVQAKQGNMQKAKELRRYAYQTAIDFNLEEQPDIEAVFNTVKTVALTPECNRKQTEFKKLLADGRARSTALEYLKAAEALETAIGLAKSDEECLISAAPARTELARIKTPLLYLRQVAKASRFVRDRKSDSAYYAFKSAEGMLGSLGAARSKLSVPFTKFIRDEDEAGFTDFALHELTVKGELDTAAAVFRQTSAKNKTKGPVAETGARLAEALAQRDYRLVPRQEPGHYVATYFKGEKAPKPFEKAYFGKWKELEKAQ